MIKTCCTNIYNFVGLLTPHEKGESQTIKEKKFQLTIFETTNVFPFFLSSSRKRRKK